MRVICLQHEAGTCMLQCRHTVYHEQEEKCQMPCHDGKKCVQEFLIEVRREKISSEVVYNVRDDNSHLQSEDADTCRPLLS